MMAGEFDAIEKPLERVQVGGRTFEVRPLTIGQLPAFTRHIRPLAGALQPLLAGDGAADGDFVATLLDLVSDHGDAMIEAASVALRVPRADIEALDPLEFVSLLLPIVRINADFFARRLQPALRAAIGQAAAINGGGQTPSKP